MIAPDPRARPASSLRTPRALPPPLRSELEAAYEEFHLEKEGNLISPNTLQH
jgi:hypothetical protein